MITPRFAIVGHPNKGKSSIVATLARDESVAISPIPGTTAENRVYPMQVDGETLYELVDTPGFQRGRMALEWMQAQEGNSAGRADIVRRFVDRHRDDPRFAAECNLLQPILDGAGILYVVDGSRPFGEEYEAEMEILRWTGQPSMALINLIRDNDHTVEWENALDQYFRIVRVFNALTADFDRRIQLLLAFGQMREMWRQPLEEAVEILREEQVQRGEQSARVIAETVARMITYSTQRAQVQETPTEKEKDELKKAYREKLAGMEQRCRKRVERIYSYRGVERHGPLLELLDENLFAEESWKLFGLTQPQLIATGTMGGAATGSVIDLAVGGSFLFLGTGLGALVGGASTWLTANRIADIKILGLPLGGKELRVGPMHNINFPYVALGRALLHQRLIEDRTHAQRDLLELRELGALGEHSTAMQGLDSAQRKRLEKIFSRLRKQEATSPQLIDGLIKEVEELVRQPDGNFRSTNDN